MKLIRKIVILFFIFIAVLLFAKANAQETASIKARATVIAGITITAEHDLLFGTVLPDVDKAVAKADIGFAGEWHIAGDNSAEVTLEFTLPDSLIHADSVASMPIDFNNTDASYDDGTGGGQSAPVAEINPNGPITVDLGPAGILDVWIGGTVRPKISQTGGEYSADVTLSVAYTGN